MKHKIRSRWYMRKNLFIHLLASAKSGKVSKNLQLWAYYRLGMYESVLALDVKKLSWRGMVAKIVSFAALNHYDDAQRLLDDFDKCKRCKGRSSLLFNALVPHLKYLNFNLQKKVMLSKSLELLLMSKDDTSLEIFQKYMQNKLYRQEPDFLLVYRNSLYDISTQKALRLLNVYLAQFGLTKIRYKNANLALNVYNMKNDKQMYKKGALVTVIVTTYNSQKTIQIALESLLQQSYKNLEIIVLDDCSQDDTVAVVKRFSKEDSRIRLVELEKNIGTYGAKNIALENAKGEFITCHDSDDFSHARKIELQVMPLINDSRLVASISDWIRVDDDGRFYSRYVYPFKRMNLSSLLFRRKEIVSKIGFYDSVRTGADSEFYARLLLGFGKKRIKRIKKPLSFGAHRENSLMTSKTTGYDKSGISYSRLSYWESWNQWHIDEVTFNRVPYISLEHYVHRKFDAPSDILITKSEIKYIQEYEVKI